MRVVLDTNVFVSGVFFSGPPSTVVDLCVLGRVEALVSPAILDEYHRVGQELTRSRPTSAFPQVLALFAGAATVVNPEPLHPGRCRDRDDDKFLACAFAGKADAIITGDKDLLALSGQVEVAVIKPREFLARFLGAGS